MSKLCRLSINNVGIKKNVQRTNLNFRGISDSITMYIIYIIHIHLGTYVLICTNMYMHEHNIVCLLSGVIAQTETHEQRVIVSRDQFSRCVPES